MNRLIAATGIAALVAAWIAWPDAMWLAARVVIVAALLTSALMLATFLVFPWRVEPRRRVEDVVATPVADGVERWLAARPSSCCCLVHSTSCCPVHGLVP